MTAQVHSLADHKAFTCDCGSVDFALLMSDGIECNGCQKRHPFEWRQYDANECPDCGGHGKRAVDQGVDSSSYTLPAWECCDTCSGLGLCGPDAEAKAATL
jgi:hypothetical protein